jgi:Fcf2 pre-rRNA processing
MRSVLDPHRHYKKNSSKSKFPEFSQSGTVIEGPTEFYSSRINRKDRSKTFVEETMATEKENGRFKRKYNEIQEKKMSGKKGHYKALMKKRRKT